MQAQGVVREVVEKLLVSALAAEEALTRPGLPKQAVTANAAVRAWGTRRGRAGDGRGTATEGRYSGGGARVGD